MVSPRVLMREGWGVSQSHNLRVSSRQVATLKSQGPQSLMIFEVPHEVEWGRVESIHGFDGEESLAKVVSRSDATDGSVFCEELGASVMDKSGLNSTGRVRVMGSYFLSPTDGVRFTKSVAPALARAKRKKAKQSHVCRAGISMSRWYAQQCDATEVTILFGVGARLGYSSLLQQKKALGFEYSKERAAAVFGVVLLPLLNAMLPWFLRAVGNTKKALSVPLLIISEMIMVSVYVMNTELDLPDDPTTVVLLAVAAMMGSLI